MTLPQPWPPGRDVILFSGATEAGEVQLVGRSTGTLQVVVTSPQNRLDTEFQPIDIVGGGFGTMMVSWSNQSISLKFSGQVIERNSADPRTLTIHTRTNVRRDDADVFPNPATIPNRDDRFFVQTLMELQSRMTGDVYEAIKASGLLRLVLLDGLIGKITRRHRVKPKFHVVQHEFLDFVDTQWQILLPSDLLAKRGPRVT